MYQSMLQIKSLYFFEPKLILQSAHRINTPVLIQLRINLRYFSITFLLERYATLDIGCVGDIQTQDYSQQRLKIKLSQANNL